MWTILFFSLLASDDSYIILCQFIFNNNNNLLRCTSKGSFLKNLIKQGPWYNPNRFFFPFWQRVSCGWRWRDFDMKRFEIPTPSVLATDSLFKRWHDKWQLPNKVTLFPVRVLNSVSLHLSVTALQTCWSLSPSGCQPSSAAAAAASELPLPGHVDVYVWAAALQKWPEATKHVFSPLGSENWADNVSTVRLQLIIRVNLSMLLLRVRWSRF